MPREEALEPAAPEALMPREEALEPAARAEERPSLFSDMEEDRPEAVMDLTQAYLMEGEDEEAPSLLPDMEEDRSEAVPDLTQETLMKEEAEEAKEALTEADNALRAGYLAAAIVILENAIDSYPRDIPILLRLEELYRKQNRHAEALSCLERLRYVISDPGHRLWILLHAGLLAMDDLSDQEQGHKYLRLALKLIEDDAGLLIQFLEFFKTREFWPAYIEAAVQLESLQDEFADDGAFLAELGQAFLAVGKTKEALKRLKNALTRLPDNQDILNLTMETARKLNLWGDYLELARKRLRELPEKEARVLSREMMEAVGKSEMDPLRLRPILADILALSGETDVKREYARCLFYDPESLDEALVQYQQLLLADISDAEVHDALLRLYLDRSENNRATFHHAILGFLGKQSQTVKLPPALSAIRDMRRPEPEVLGKLIADEQRWERLCVHAHEQGPMRKLFQLLGQYLSGMLIFDLNSINTPIDGPLEPTGDFNPLAMLEESQKALRTNRVKVMAYHSSERPLRIINTDPPVILVDLDMVAGMTPAQWRFVAGRCLYFIHAGTVPIIELEHSELMEMIMMLGKFCHSTRFVLPGIEEKVVKKNLRRLKRMVPRNIRREAKAYSEKYQMAWDRYPVERWTEGMIHTANRLGLLLAGDLGDALQALRKILGGGDPATLLTQNKEISELARYGLSDKYLEIIGAQS